MDNVFGSESGQKVLKRKRQDMQSCLSRYIGKKKLYMVSQQVWCIKYEVPTLSPEQNLLYEKFQVVY